MLWKGSTLHSAVATTKKLVFFSLIFRIFEILQKLQRDNFDFCHTNLSLRFEMFPESHIIVQQN